MKGKFFKYLTMTMAVSCCVLLTDKGSYGKSISSANAGKDIDISTKYSGKESIADTPSVYKRVADSDNVVNGYPKSEFKYEVNDNGDITILPFLRYTYVNEDGNIAWSEPVKDIEEIKEYFNNEDITDMVSEVGKYNIDVHMLEK